MDYFLRDGRSEEDVERIILAFAPAHIPGTIELIDFIEAVHAIGVRLKEERT